MFRDQLERLTHPAFFGFYLILPIFFFQVDNPRVHHFVLPAIAAVAFFAWLLSLRRLLAIDSTPASKIEAAAQGYVELVGRGRSPPNFQTLSQLRHLPCLWYRYSVEERGGRDNKWRQVDSGRSDASFIIDDGTGICLVDPEQAEIITTHKEVWTEENLRYSEWTIAPQDEVCVLGEFSTIGGESAELDEKRDVSELLAEWKHDTPTLMARFDLDKDGQLSEQEWMLARAQATREVRKTHNEIRSQPGTNVMNRPRDGRLFLISNIGARKLARRYRLWAWLHLFVAIGAVAGTAYFAR